MAVISISNRLHLRRSSPRGQIKWIGSLVKSVHGHDRQRCQGRTEQTAMMKPLTYLSYVSESDSVTQRRNSQVHLVESRHKSGDCLAGFLPIPVVRMWGANAAMWPPRGRVVLRNSLVNRWSQARASPNRMMWWVAIARQWRSYCSCANDPRTL